jgi:hypothetical protein
MVLGSYYIARQVCGFDIHGRNFENLWISNYNSENLFKATSLPM